MTYSAKCFEGLFRDKGSIQAKEKDGCVGEHSSEDDEVVHIRARHLYQPDKREGDTVVNENVNVVIP